MTRPWLSSLAILALAACQPQVPDSAAGVGFSDYGAYANQQAAERAAREAQLSGETTVLPPEATGAPAPASTPAVGLSAADLAAAGIGPQTPSVRTAPVQSAAVQTASAPTSTAPSAEPLSALRPGALAGTPAAAPSAASPQTTAVGSVAPAAISDEQEFRAVASRETIESDAERLRQQRSQYRQVTVTSTAAPSGGAGPDIVAFALQSQNAVGQRVYSRTFGSENKMRRNCSRYTAPDIAQRTFLEQGGPQRDRLGLDPDGDGFACSWSPEPFRAAVRG